MSAQPRSGDGASRTRSASLVIIATVAAGAALFFAQEIFIPLALGFLFTALFRPLVQGLKEVKIPAPLSATLIVLGCLGLLGAAVFFTSRPGVANWKSSAVRSSKSPRQSKRRRNRSPARKSRPRGRRRLHRRPPTASGSLPFWEESLPPPPGFLALCCRRLWSSFSRWPR